MTLESALGITASIIGIGTLLCSLAYRAYNRIKRKDLSTILSKLTDKKLSLAKQHKILKLIDIIFRTYGKNLTSEYIRTFAANGRSKSIIFHDICMKNNIEPTADLCKRALGYDEPTFRKEWQQKYLSSAAVNTEKKEDAKIASEYIVYLSELLLQKFPETYSSLITILDKYSISHALLKSTRDIWCRDYMPVQTESGKLIQFRYDPSYLKEKPEYISSRSDVKEVCRDNGINPIFSDINLDGGNVVLYGRKAIITDRIYSENPKCSREELRKKLSELLEAEIIIIPAYGKASDFTGHADGMIRFVDSGTVIGFDNERESPSWKEKMERALRLANLKYINFPFFEYEIENNHEHAIGVYLNYLEVGNLIVMPVFGFPGNKDAEALSILKELFPSKIIETINYNDVAIHGGVLNCTTWVLRK
ncbi:MAG: agmatine deiminase family protein [Alistipes sp.]|nr:agmatine deiminase family protein [Alistipes sp.]